MRTSWRPAGAVNRSSQERLACCQTAGSSSFCPLRPVTDHDLGAGHVQFEKGLDILFDRHASDVDHQRPGPVDQHRILILGGDGFCGWPTALHLSDAGYEIAIVDNLLRRMIDLELEVDSLTPIRPMSERLAAWHEISGREIAFHRFHVARNYQRLVDLLTDWSPDAVVHFAEQRAAPCSMKSAAYKRYTVDHNVGATNTLLAAIVEASGDAHVVHLGTMGVYGYGTAGMKIPEGYLKAASAISSMPWNRAKASAY